MGKWPVTHLAVAVDSLSALCNGRLCAASQPSWIRIDTKGRGDISMESSRPTRKTTKFRERPGPMGISCYGNDTVKIFGNSETRSLSRASGLQRPLSANEISRRKTDVPVIDASFRYHARPTTWLPIETPIPAAQMPFMIIGAPRCRSRGGASRARPLDFPYARHVTSHTGNPRESCGAGRSQGLIHV